VNRNKQETTSFLEERSFGSALQGQAQQGEGELVDRPVTHEERPLSFAPPAAENRLDPFGSMTNTALLENLSLTQTQEFPPKRELRITLQNNINYTLDNAISLSIILARNETYPWFYESYVQLYSVRLLRRPVAGFHPMVRDNQLRGGEVESIAVHFAVMSGKTWFKECLVKNFFGRDPDDIISFIVRSINLECYLRLEIDEYYLPNKRSFGRRQWVHPTLVYGYDNETKTVLGLGFDTQSFTRLTFSYDDVRSAYASARRISQDLAINKALVSLIKMREPTRRYPFSIHRFLTELEGYLSSTIDSARKYALTTFFPANVDVDAVIRLGVGVYEHFEIGLRQLLLGSTWMTYASMHALFEHKRFLYEALKFIISEYQVKGRLVELTDEFQRVVRAFNSMRWKYIRYDVSKDLRLIKEIIEQLELAKAEEREQLQRIYDQIRIDHQNLS
jgi:hypothetical protein